MLNVIEKVDKYGNTKINYRLTQGDTFSVAIKDITSTDGSVVDNEIIERITFKFLDEDDNILYCQNFEYDTDYKEYHLIVSNVITKDWAVDTYKYEYEVVFKDGTVDTVMFSKFEITEQGIGGDICQ